MSKQRQPLLRNNCRQLLWVVLGFVLCISLLEAKGLVVWAQRLEVGPLQQGILRLVEAVDRSWSAVAAPVTEFRSQALGFLTKHGWSDMPVDTQDNAGSITGGATGQDGASLVVPGGADGDGGDTPPPAQPGGEEATGQPDGTGILVPPGYAGVTAEQMQQGWLPAIQPAEDMKLPQLPQAQTEKPRYVVLAGDSMMAVGLGAQLQRDLAAYRNSVVTVKAFRSATGLARPDVFDWQKEYPLMVGSNVKPAVVIVAIGANDTQNLEVNRKVLTLGSTEWRDVYASRLTDYLNMLTRDGAVVLWIKLPPMRPNKYNQNINVVNEVAYSVVSQNPRAIWWDVSDRFTDANGKFQEFATVQGARRPIRIRQADGIHLSDEGAKLLTGDIVTWLNPAPLQPPKPPELPPEPLPEPAPEQGLPAEPLSGSVEVPSAGAPVVSANPVTPATPAQEQIAQPQSEPVEIMPPAQPSQPAGE